MSSSDQGVIAATTKRGLRPTAFPDITARARSVFRLEQGVARAFEADGQTLRYGKHGVTAMEESRPEPAQSRSLALTPETSVRRLTFGPPPDRRLRFPFRLRTSAAARADLPRA